MAETAEILVGLRDIHTPPLALPEMLADGFLAIAVGMAVAILVGLLFRPLTRRTRSPRELALGELAQSRKLVPPERLIAQARLLRRFAAELEPSPELMTKLRDALYQPGGGAHAERLDQEVSLLLQQLRS